MNVLWTYLWLIEKHIPWIIICYIDSIESLNNEKNQDVNVILVGINYFHVKIYVLIFHLLMVKTSFTSSVAIDGQCLDNVDVL